MRGPVRIDTRQREFTLPHSITMYPDSAVATFGNKFEAFIAGMEIKAELTTRDWQCQSDNKDRRYVESHDSGKLPESCMVLRIKEYIQYEGVIGEPVFASSVGSSSRRAGYNNMRYQQYDLIIHQ